MTMKKRQRLTEAERKAQILTAALYLAEREGYDRITREQIAERAGVSVGLVGIYFGTMPKFRRALMRAAIQEGRAAVVAQGLARRDPHALKAPDSLKSKAVAALMAG